MLDRQKSVALENLKGLLAEVGIDLPNYKMREVEQQLRDNNRLDGDNLSKENFVKLCDTLKADDVSRTFKTSRVAEQDAEKIEREFGGYNTVLDEEQVAFADWINNSLADDKDVSHKLKLKLDGTDLYKKMDDGVLLCKIINLACPDTIDERVINTGKKISIFQEHENLTLAINSAKAIGCIVIGIDSHTLNSSQGKKWLVLGLLWQLIKMYLFQQITISQVPGLVNLLMDGEDINDLMKLSPEQLLLKWVNYQLDQVILTSDWLTQYNTHL